MTCLQVALDIVNLNRALEIARKVIEGGADIIEVGTPLIKRYGTLPIKAIEAEFPDVKILADSKTIDAGAIEASIMFEAGADMMTVLGLADNVTIAYALDVAEEFGCEIVIDLINVREVVERALELYDFGLRNFCFHIGIDIQRARKASVITLLSEIEELKKVTNIKAFVAGGIKLKDLQHILKAPVNVVVVGNAIIHSHDPLGATKRFKEILKKYSG